ncbi:hypothetical protein Taro_011017 [Colocasia esculenta]|uniref:SET domain-containing protein n=1 Tax=Colocasia esculenta TaxID=4460 RepID=A0A843U573_COLES|nr:hypothetical protein [Colocasia esculenta]
MSSSEAAPAPATPLPPQPSLQVVPNIPRRGRALVAARAIKPGEVLLVDSPLLLYPNLDVAADSASSSSSSSYCAHCYRTLPSGGPSFPCLGCSGHARFCSDTCRTLGAACSHTPWVCRALSILHATAPHLPPPLDHHPEALSQAAFLIAAYNLSAISPDGFVDLLSLQGGATPEHAALALHFLVASLSPVPTGPAGFSPELTASLLAKDKMNAFGLMEPATGGTGERRVRAYGIYPKASFFNHDCLPNACRFDYIDGAVVGGRNADIVVRSIHDIPEGREVCLSYFPVNWGYKERQRRLLEDYGFTCECDRCMVEKTWKDEEDELEEEAMDDEEMEGGEAGGEDEGMGGMEDGDFPHAYFFMRYMCQRESCGGTLAPLALSAQSVVSDVMECNVCGRLSRGDDPDTDPGSACLQLEANPILIECGLSSLRDPVMSSLVYVSM